MEKQKSATRGGSGGAWRRLGESALWSEARRRTTSRRGMDPAPGERDGGAWALGPPAGRRLQLVTITSRPIEPQRFEGTLKRRTNLTHLLNAAAKRKKTGSGGARLSCPIGPPVLETEVLPWHVPEKIPNQRLSSVERGVERPGLVRRNGALATIALRMGEAKQSVAAMG